MASTSASSIQKRFKYDVFLSFRGKDTRKTFVDHLYKALDDKGIITYKDNERIEKGEMIDEQLMRSIEDSRFYIVVFSKNYASSSWCLEELVKIMECQKMTEHTTYPIFYDVEPTELRNQSGSVGEAFAKNVKEEFTRKRRRTLEDADLENEDDVGRWRNAMKEAAGLAGMELKNTFNGHEAKCIQKIVEDVSLKLHFTNFTVDGKLVGMETRVKSIVSSLEIGFEDVRMIGIKGMGGSGKTTLARAVFDHISIWFEGKSFVENVREGSKGSGLKKLQKLILSTVLNDKSIYVTGVSDGKAMLKMRMRNRKVLVVLDDVDDIEQLEALAGELTWFKPGSRIIITTRDEQVLVAHGVNSDDIHDVNLLTHKEAICLFSRYAFKSDIPNQGYEDLSGKVVNYAAGLPLTIKVLGSHLCGRSELEWVDAIERLKKIPLKETLKRLEISYDGLEDDQKEIFLDVVCILKGERIDGAIRVLESCGFNAQIGLRVLEQKSLITISNDDDKHLGMHDHIEEMGQNIVRRVHPHEPSKHSRLWIKHEIEHILYNGLVSETRCIKLVYTDLQTKVIMKGLRNMRELRVLHVHTGFRKLKVDEVSQYLPETLHSLYWQSYDLRYLPKTFQANKLVNLEMGISCISQLWEGRERKVLNKIRFLNLAHSNLKTFDLRMTPRLEKLNLRNCFEFVELHLPVECPNLKSLDLSSSMLRTFDLKLTPRLEKLDLGGCNDFIELNLPVKCSNLKSLNLSGSKLRNFDLRMTPHLEELDLRECNDFVELYMPVECPNLKFLNLSDSKLRTFDLRLTPHLETLNLGECNEFVELYMPCECSNLKALDLSGSKVSNLNLEMTLHLKHLNLEGCYDLQEIHAPVGCLKNLYSINLSGCLRFYFFLFERENGPGTTLDLNVQFCDTCRLHPHNSLPEFKFKCKFEESLTSWSGTIEKLISFGECACTKLESFSANICGLQRLKELKLEGSIPEALFNDLYMLETIESLVLRMKEIKHIPDGIDMLKHLKSLEFKSCDRLEKIPKNICRLQQLKSLNLSDCILIDELPKELERLECLELNITSCKSLRHIPNSICNMKCLKRLHLSNCIVIEKLPEELGCLECLEKLDLEGCKSLRDIPNNICNMRCLKKLDLTNCILIEKLPQELGCLECLEQLHLKGCESLRDIPNSIGNMKRLKHLDLTHCILIEKLPEELGRVECLEVLVLVGCESLRNIPNSICNLKCLKHLNLSRCILVEKLSEELERLECLEELNLTGCRSLQDIPNNICNMKCLKRLCLFDCILVEKLPEELGRLQCLKMLHLNGAGIKGLPESIYQLKRLFIFGSREQLESYGFTSLRFASQECYYVQL